jgi:hypothetical protein
VTAAADQETTGLELAAGEAPVLLFAGGTTGLVLLAGERRAQGLCAELGERAEESGLSALAFAGAIPGDAADAVGAAAALLGRLGVERTALLAVGRAAAAALRATAGGAFGAVILVEPALAPDEAESLLAEVPAPKLVVARGSDPESQAAAAAAYRHAIGPMAVRHVPGDDLFDGETAAMIAEAAIAFAIASCGDGRRA